MTEVFVNKDNGSRFIIVTDEPDSICELCGKVDETRPYGPNGEKICYDCGMKDEATTDKMIKKVLFGITHDD